MPISSDATDRGDFAIHVFTTDGYTAKERVTGSGVSGWADGSFNQPANEISATSWVDAQGGHIRVYCTTENFTVEWCLDASSSTDWYQGGFTTN